jgi:hypothetical protein
MRAEQYHKSGMFEACRAVGHTIPRAGFVNQNIAKRED